MEERFDYIGVLIVSAHPLVREGIISVLSGQDDIKVVGYASNRLELMERIYNLDPNIIVVHDEDNKDTNSLEAIQLINHRATNARVLLLVEDDDEDKELTALKMGVRGFLLERTGKDDFIKCIKAINRGEMWVRRKIMEKLIHQLLVNQKREEYLGLSAPSLTKRELEVITLVSRGYKNKEIGRVLFISERTVKHYLTNIFKKFNIKRRTDILHRIQLICLYLWIPLISISQTLMMQDLG